MTGTMRRRSVPDRARRRAIRAFAARLGVSYSVAARLLAARMGAPAGGTSPGPVPEPDDHRAWLFAMRERRSFDLRVRDTRLAADPPVGRAAHLAERFPPLRRPGPHGGDGGGLYGGEGREVVLGLLYAILAHESPALVPAAGERAWVAELGEESAVDTTCAALDRAARLLLDEDPWRLWTRAEAAVLAGEASPDRAVRDAAITLGRTFRTTILRRSIEGARNTLDALLLTACDGYPPGTEVRLLVEAGEGPTGTVIGARWQRTGPPTGYEVRTGGAILVVPRDGLAPRAEPALA